MDPWRIRRELIGYPKCTAEVLGEIPILASEQRLLDEANGGEEGGGEDGDASGKSDKPKEGGGRPRVLADGTYATETAYTSTSWRPSRRLRNPL